MANQEMVRFNGNCPSNVNKDAKYTVKLEQGEYVVGIFYRSSDGELWYPTSGNHPELVEMVNKVKFTSVEVPVVLSTSMSITR